MQLQQSQQQAIKTNLGLQQTIKILQFNSTELSVFVDNELLTNPFLDKEYTTQTSSSETNQKSNQSISYSIKYPSSQRKGFYNNHDELINVAANISLKQHVINQLNIYFSKSIELNIAYYLTDLLQDSGYIADDLQIVSHQLNYSYKYILKILAKLQQLEPTGIFARSLAECLTLQLKEKQLYNERYKLLLNNLPTLAAKQFTQLAKKLNIDVAELQQMITHIKKLNPKPGHRFCAEQAVVKIPDAYVHLDDQNNLFVSLPDESKFQVTVNKQYYTKIKNSIKSTDQRKFINERYNSAIMLLSSLSMRSAAIFKVTQAIVNLQQDFFTKGLFHLRPLTLKLVAQYTGMSESSISRITTGKYISCGYGVFEMKYFFSASIASCDSSSKVSATKVQAIISKLVELETKQQPLSDDNIRQELLKFNIQIARRTVTKYREQLKIETSHLRRQLEYHF